MEDSPARAALENGHKRKKLPATTIRGTGSRLGGGRMRPAREWVVAYEWTGSDAGGGVGGLGTLKLYTGDILETCDKFRSALLSSTRKRGMVAPVSHWQKTEKQRFTEGPRPLVAVFPAIWSDAADIVHAAPHEFLARRCDPPIRPALHRPRFPSTMPAARFRLRPEIRFKETHAP
jgi:hypothetical protein